MYKDPDLPELVSVVGTDAFMDFVESIKSEGVELEHKGMGEGTDPKAPLVIEVDKENLKKDIDKLDIEIPVLTPRIYREYKNLSQLNIGEFKFQKIALKEFSEQEKREIVFRDIASGEITHKTELDSNFIPNYQSVIGYFTQIIMKELRLVSAYDILYGKVKEFIQDDLFNKKIELDNLNSLRNLSEIEASRTVIETFKREINALTVLDKGEAEIGTILRLAGAGRSLLKTRDTSCQRKVYLIRLSPIAILSLNLPAFLKVART